MEWVDNGWRAVQTMQRLTVSRMTADSLTQCHRTEAGAMHVTSGPEHGGVCRGARPLLTWKRNEISAMTPVQRKVSVAVRRARRREYLCRRRLGCALNGIIREGRTNIQQYKLSDGWWWAKGWRDLQAGRIKWTCGRMGCDMGGPE